MKREGNLYLQIAGMDNLRLAFWKARRGKDARPDVIAFRRSLETNLRELRRELLNEDVPVGACHTFTIYDPKERVICAAAFRERVLHHAIMNVCHPVFERYQIFDSYASRPGKGMHAALRRAGEFTARGGWFLKLDVRQYFASIDHGVLKNQLARLFRERSLLRLFARILDAHDGPVGLPIGHLTSQYFANHFLAVGDHRLKEEWHLRRYVRYMDDMVLWADTKQRLAIAHSRLTRFLKRELSLDVKPPCLHRVENGLPFLGHVVFPDHVTLARRSRKRYARKLRRAWTNHAMGLWSQEEFATRTIPLIAATEHATDGISFRRRVAEQLERSLEGLEPCEPRRQLEQQRQELPLRVPQQERAGQPEQQPGCPARPRSSGDRRMPSSEPGAFRAREGALAAAGGSLDNAKPVVAPILDAAASMPAEEVES